MSRVVADLCAGKRFEFSSTGEVGDLTLSHITAFLERVAQEHEGLAWSS